MRMDPPARKIIHIECDCFFAAVEMRDHPEWRDVPLAVGGAPAARAATRRGSSITIFCRLSQGSSSSCNGSQVVLPEPVSAVRTTAGEAASAAFSSSKAWATGRFRLAVFYLAQRR